MCGWSAMAFVGSFGSVRGGSMSIGDLTFNGVYPRIFSPNGDGANDKAVFHFSNPEQLPVSGEIFDLPGAKVASLSPGPDPASMLTWDGKDSDGRTVPGGIYLYQIDFQGKVITGTVVVAR
jgi:hypothetical protein